MSFEALVDHNQSSPVITLKDNSNGTMAEIYAFGALLNAFKMVADGRFFNAVAGFDSVADAEKEITQGFKSAKLSPFVCRMREGKFVWDDDHFQIEKHYLNAHAIHGIIYDALFELQSTKADQTGASVDLCYAYPGSDRGFPFPFLIQIHWRLEAGNRITVTTNITNASSSEIPLSDGWHPYFSLGDTIDDCMLQFDSEEQLEFDDALLPTGKMFPDTRFSKGSLLKNIHLDNCFKLDQLKTRPSCVLSNQQFKLRIEPDASYPYLQVYTPDDRKMIAIENLSSAPDAFNNQMGLIRLEPNEIRSFTTSYILQSL